MNICNKYFIILFVVCLNIGLPLISGVGIQPFNFADHDSNLALDWKMWLRSFELFIKAYEIRRADNGAEQEIDKCALLLHHAGPKVQNIYDSLEDAVDEVPRGPLANSMNPHLTDYERMISKLDNFFAPKRGPHYEQYIFGMMTQKESEKIEFFAVRLKQQARRCSYGDQLQQNMKNQLIKGCLSTGLREKLLEHGNDDFDKLLSRAKTYEVVNEQKKIFNQKNADYKPLSEPVYKISGRNLRNPVDQTNNITCNRCGYKGHRAADENCPAKGKKCNKCGLIGHFAGKCRTKEDRVNLKRTSLDTKNQVNMKRPKQENEAVQFIAQSVNEGPNSSDDDVFCIISSQNGHKVGCEIGNVGLGAIIDSGSENNLVDEKSWKYLKLHHVKVSNKQKETDKEFKAYGGHKLTVLGTFMAELKIGNKRSMAKFYVIKGEGKLLIGRNTAEQLGILKMGEDVNVNKISTVTNEFSKIKNVMVNIPVRGDVKPVIQPYRRIPVPLEKIVDEKIEQLLKLGIIEKFHGSPSWVSPLVIVPRSQSDDIRICVDMRRANQAVDRENHPLPTFEDFLPKLENAKLFSKIDIKNAFHQVEIAPDSRDITTFITRKGLFRYKRLMFGITCAPEIFQKIMEQILSGLEGCVNFIDDILVFGSVAREHDERLQAVMDRLKSFDVTLNIGKCIFGVTTVQFLGHRLSSDGIAPSSDKVEAIKQFRRPETAEETRSFLGLVNYVGKFIPNLATITDPLRKLTRNTVPFEWKQEQDQAFEELKKHMCHDMALGYYNVNDRIQVFADASPVGLGAVLVQFSGNDPRIITYASKSLSSVEKRYAQTEKEALALVWAVERFHHYLFGRTFELVTDHKPLETIFGPKSKPCARIERWVLRLQSYQYKVIYKPGKSNIADPLSRLLPVSHSTEPTALSRKADNYVNWIIAKAEPKAIKLSEIDGESQSDETIEAVKGALDSDEWLDLAAPYKFIKTELCFAGNILLRGSRIIIPKNLHGRILELAHEGHPGMTKMKQRLRAKVWWPKMDQLVDQYVKECPGCMMIGAPSAPEPMKRYELPKGPWQHLAMDYMGILPSGHHLLVIVDYFSRFIEVMLMTKIDSSATINRLKDIFARFGFPHSIVADNAKQFISQELRDYCSTNNIELRNTIPYWPQMNGEVEVQNKSVKKHIKISQVMGKDWKNELHEYLLMYRSTPQLTTMKSPAELMFGRTIKDKLPTIYQPMEVDQQLSDQDKLNKEKGKEYGDKKRKAELGSIKEGDMVLAKRQIYTSKLDSNFQPEVFKVIKKKGGDVIIESVNGGVQYRRNISHLKKIPENTLQTMNSNLPSLKTESSATPPTTTTSASTSTSQATSTMALLGIPDISSTSSSNVSAPKRQRKLVQRYGDCVP